MGTENLTANGIDLPDVAGAVMSGTASGDWTLSCVRGQVESITFVFTDGTIRTVPQPKAVASRNASTTQSSNTDKIRGGLGYLSIRMALLVLLASAARTLSNTSVARA